MAHATIEQQESLLRLAMQSHVPAHKFPLLVVKYRPHSSFLFAARRTMDGQILVELGVGFFDARCNRIVVRACRAALEIIEYRTKAVIVREPETDSSPVKVFA